MKKIIHLLRESLDISQKEAKSTLAFLLVALISLFTYIIVNFFTSRNQVKLIINAVPETALNSNEIPEMEESENPASYSKIQKFKFDPNTASIEDFKNLGISQRTAQTIINYRNKGGKFRYRSDLQKIYNLNPQLYAELYPWINLPDKTTSSDPQEFLVENATEPSTSKETKLNPKILNEYNPTPISSFDINLADTSQLKSLKGIGSVYAGRIVKFRDALGGFHHIDQLEETFGISPEALEELKKYSFVKSPVKTININEVKNLNHPYLKANQAKAVIAYRDQHGSFKSADDLSQIKILDAKTIQKIAPYLSF